MFAVIMAEIGREIKKRLSIGFPISLGLFANIDDDGICNSFN
jgi:hypothetical protein